MPKRIRIAEDHTLREKVKKLEDLELKGSDAVREYMDQMRQWDPRIVSMAINSDPDWRDWLVDNNQNHNNMLQ